MIRPDEETLKALIRIRVADPFAWEKILFWISNSLQQVLHNLGDNTVFNAGRIAELGDLMEKIENAPAELEKLERGPL